MNCSYFKSLALLAPALLVACVTVYEPLPERTERTYAAITSHSDHFNPQPGQSFAWFTNGVVASADGTGTPVAASVQQLIVQTLERELVAQGYRRAASANGADFLIGAGLFDREAEQTGAMSEFIHVFPAIRETLDSEQPLSLLVAAGAPANLDQHQLLWRGSVNAAVAAADLPDSEREELIRELVNSLLQQFP